MSTKLTPDVIVKAATQVGIDKEKRQALLEMLADMTAPDGDEEKAPPIKKQFVFVLADPLGKFTGPNGEMRKEIEEIWGALTGWVVQLPESDSPHTAPQRVIEAAHHFNTTKKGRLLPVQTIGEAFESVPARLFKEQAIWVKTKCAVYAIPVAIEIPETPSILGDDRGEPKAK